MSDIKQRKRIPREKTVSRVFQFIKKTRKPVHQSFLHKTLQVDWKSLTIILSKLIEEKKIQKIETIRFDYFTLNKGDDDFGSIDCMDFFSAD